MSWQTATADSERKRGGLRGNELVYLLARNNKQLFADSLAIRPNNDDGLLEEICGRAAELSWVLIEYRPI